VSWPAPAAPADLLTGLSTIEAIAVGIVMHRFSLARTAALQRLQRLAEQEGRSLVQTCSAVVVALEQLALPGTLDQPSVK
jgi:response regulator NasT